MEKTERKRIIIIFVYLFIFLFVGTEAYIHFKPKASCFDGIQNQNEQGIDCGGVCQKECNEIKAQNLVVGKTGLVPSGIRGKYDFYAQIFNPNAVFGSKKFNYKLELKDSSGKIIVSKSGSNFILPGERKYIIVDNIEILDKHVSTNFKIIDSDWIEFNNYYASPNVEIVNKNYSEVSEGTNFSRAKGLLKNDSPYDFNLIKIEVILKNTNGKILALNSTEMKTVNSGEQRDFTLFWPNRFPGSVDKMETQTEVNIFKSDTFLKKFYKTEKFQQY